MSRITILLILEVVIEADVEDLIMFLMKTILDEANVVVIEAIKGAFTIIMAIMNKIENKFKKDKTNGEEEGVATSTSKINNKMEHNIKKDSTHIEVEITKVVEVSREVSHLAKEKALAILENKLLSLETEGAEVVSKIEMLKVLRKSVINSIVVGATSIVELVTTSEAVANTKDRSEITTELVFAEAVEDTLVVITPNCNSKKASTNKLARAQVLNKVNSEVTYKLQAVNHY